MPESPTSSSTLLATAYPSPPLEYTTQDPFTVHHSTLDTRQSTASAPLNASPRSLASTTSLEHTASTAPEHAPPTKQAPAQHQHRQGHHTAPLATPSCTVLQTPTPDNTRPSHTAINMSNAAANPSTSPTSGKRTFDPFAPLPSSQPPLKLFNAPASTSREPSPNGGSSASSFAAHNGSPSISRPPRPSSLYIPMSDSPKTNNTGNTPTWPFGKDAPDGNSLGVHPPATGATPLSPSQIHPSYADLPGATALHQSPPMSSEPAHKLYSAIPISAASDSDAAYSSSSVRGLSRTPSPNVAAKGRGAHMSNYSVGTHALLGSRSTPSSRLAERLDTPTAWLVLYFAFNLGLTLFNKLVLQGFPFPWTLTAIQMLSGTIGTQIALQQGYFTQARLTTKENGIMFMFSGLYTINIAVSNLSLHLVSVPFHQVVRAMTPLFTIIISIIFVRKRHSRQTYLSLLPVILGVVFATYGDYSFTPWGFILTLLGTLLAALKTIITNRVQVGRLKLHPLDLLVRMSPLAFMQCVFFGWWSGELDRVREYGATEMTKHKAIALAVNGAIAFGLNVVSFTANKKTSALTMTVAANVKQVLTIVLAVLIFNVALNPTNLLGISLTLAGGAWYAKVELQEKTARAAAAANAPRPAPEGEKLG